MSIPSSTDAVQPFDVQKADVILRSADNVDFKMFKSLLSFSSPFFESMFMLPQSSEKAVGDEMKDGLSVVRMAENSKTMASLLPFCHPACAPELEDLQLIQPVLGAAIKYDMQGAVKRIQSMLMAPRFLEKEPLRVFAIASRFHLDEDAVLAARSTLNYTFFPRKYVLELEDITAGTLHRLQSYHYSCGKAAKVVASCFGWISLDSFIHFGADCWECSFGETVTVAESANISARKWWLEYMHDAGEALMERPCGATVMRTDLFNKALKKASECRICREKAFTELKEFGEAFAVEVESAVSTVSRRTLK